MGPALFCPFSCLPALCLCMPVRPGSQLQPQLHSLVLRPGCCVEPSVNRLEGGCLVLAKLAAAFGNCPSHLAPLNTPLPGSGPAGMSPSMSLFVSSSDSWRHRQDLDGSSFPPSVFTPQPTPESRRPQRVDLLSCNLRHEENSHTPQLTMQKQPGPRGHTTCEAG